MSGAPPWLQGESTVINDTGLYAQWWEEFWKDIMNLIPFYIRLLWGLNWVNIWKVIKTKINTLWVNKFVFIIISKTELILCLPKPTVSHVLPNSDFGSAVFSAS